MKIGVIGGTGLIGSKLREVSKIVTRLTVKTNQSNQEDSSVHTTRQATR